MSRFRRLKAQLRDLLGQDDFEQGLQAFDAPADTLTSPLLSLRLDREELVRWRAAVGLGVMAARLAVQGMEKARVLMRTFMWYMNEESGNLGWGIPEAMACAMVRHDKLAAEYHSILISYIQDEEGAEGNYLDHPELRQGAWWGLARLAGVRPELVRPAAASMVSGLDESLAMSRGCAAWALGLSGAREHRPALEKLIADTATFGLYRDDRVAEIRVADLAREALDALS